jgi:N-acetyltransferase 10
MACSSFLMQPAHHLFVLLPPVKDDESYFLELLVVLQVALEGGIFWEVMMDGHTKW